LTAMNDSWNLPAPETLEVSDRLFHEFSDIFFKRSGIRLPLERKYLIVHRLSKLMSAQGGPVDFKDLCRILKDGSNPRLIQQFVDSLTTNYSYFFRDPVHFRFLKYFFLHRMGDRKRVRIWSAACSSGEEPYSIAMTAREVLPDLDLLDFKILATDISRAMIERAVTGIYRRDIIERDIGRERIRLFFHETANPDFLEVRPEVTNIIDFREFNLLDAYPFKGLFDIVFLRNVLIYFDAEKKTRMLEKIADVLSPEGYLLLGLTESLVGTTHRFKQIDHNIYRL